MVLGRIDSIWKLWSWEIGKFELLKFVSDSQY